MHKGVTEEPRIPVMGLIGPPNSGKTTLFNSLTGASYYTANYPGATVEHSMGNLSEANGGDFKVLDLPGMGSVTPRSPDEEVAVGGLFGERSHAAPDVIIAVADCTQLARHLYLAMQLRRSGFPVVLAVTMTDLLSRRGFSLDAKVLAERMELPVIVVDPRTGGGVPELLSHVRKLAAGRTGAEPKKLPERPKAPPLEEVKSAYAITEALEKAALKPLPNLPMHTGTPDVDPLTEKVDRVMLNKFLGPLCAMLVLGALFSSVFWMAAPMMDAVNDGIGWLADRVVAIAPTSFFVRMVGDGIVRGVGSVVVFVPQILILFLGMGLLEDSGYLARVAMLVDRPLHALGLNGRSMVPLLSGFACAIPGMMAARTIPNRRERLLTLFVMPLTSCSARLPVYALLLAFLTPKDKPWVGGALLALLYLASVVNAAVVAGIAAKISGREGRSSFMLELPTYHRPLLKPIVSMALRRTWAYITKAGPAILVLASVLWLAMHLPNPPEAALVKAGAKTHAQVEQVTLEHSYAASAGRIFEPIMKPMGLDWRVGVALIAAFAAREVFVATLAIMMHVDGVEEENTAPLLDAMRDAKFPDGKPLFTVATAAGLIVFFLISLQCMSTVAVSKKESGGWTLPLAQLVTFVGLGYVAAVITVQAMRAGGIS